ncbi:transposase [Rhizobium beringeri]
MDSTGLQVYGAGQWLEEKHGARSRRGWRKLHLALDADSGEIVAHTLTDQDAGDVSQVAPLLDQIGGPIGQFTADGAYDGNLHTTQSSIIARRWLSSFRLAPTRSSHATIDRPANGTGISPQSTVTAG